MLLQQLKVSVYVLVQPTYRRALPPNHDPEEHLALTSCLREENDVSGLRLSAQLSERLHAPWKPEGGVPGLWKLDG